MAAPPTIEDSAKAILAIFSSRNVRAGEILMFSKVNAQFLQSAGRAVDFQAGLQHAIIQGWIDLSSPTMIRLTEAGFSAM
jgi:hypothetical protein